MSNPQKAPRAAQHLLVGLVGGLACLAAQAAAQERAFRAPPEFTVQRDSNDARAASAFGHARPGAGAAAPFEASLDLTITYLRGEVANPSTGRRDAVSLRGYRDAAAPPLGEALPIIAPTIRVRPGDTVRITLRNELPQDDASCTTGGGHDRPGCFNSTNLHGHGLWVSPTGNSDNVLLDLQPGSVFQYEYNIPADHPAGTFWYHPHRHGSTALQVASGMAGALIVEGDRKPGARPEEVGDIDVLTRAMPEKLLVFSQIPYGCFRNGKVQTVPDGPTKGQFTCAEGEVGTVESFYQQIGFGSAGFPGWAGTGRFTTVNGVVQPHFTLTAGQPERWRLVHAGTAAQIGFSIRPLRPGAAVPEGGVPAGRESAFIAESCAEDRQSLFGIQADGLTRATMREARVDWLQAGYRSDLLVVLPNPGLYCLVDEPDDPGTTAALLQEPQRLLGIVRVLPAAVPAVAAPALELVRAALVRQARERLEGPALARVLGELQEAAAIRLDSFVWHRPIEPSEVTGTQSLVFEVNAIAPPPTGPDEPTDRYLVNGRVYDPAIVDRILPLGGVEEWTLTANRFPHVFHIHVNPFQVIAATTDKGEDAFEVDPLFAGMKGVWKDTILVNAGYRVAIRTRYQRYIGEFVLHCHVLDHEDQGMMQNVRIALPMLRGPGAARPAPGHRH